MAVRLGDGFVFCLQAKFLHLLVLLEQVSSGVVHEGWRNVRGEGDMTVVRWCGTVNSWRGGNVTSDISVCSVPPRLGIGFCLAFLERAALLRLGKLASPTRGETGYSVSSQCTFFSV